MALQKAPQPGNTAAASISIPFVEFVCLAAFLMAMTAVSIDIMLPALPLIAGSFGVEGENERQLIVILYMVGFSVGQIFFGPISDRYGRKPILLVGLAVFIAGTCGALLATSFHAMLLARVVQGIGAASPRIIAVAVIRDLYSGRQMARVMSFAMMVFICVPVFAPTIGQALMHIGNWHWTFVLLLVMAVVVAVWSSVRLPETAQDTRASAPKLTLAQSLSAALFNARTAGYGAAGGFMFGCLLAYVASAQQVFSDVFGLEQMFPVIFGAIASAIAIASFLNASLVQRLGMRLVSHSALLGFLLVSLALTLAAAMGWAGFWTFSAAIAATFFLFGLVGPNFNAIAMEPQGHNAGMASSVTGSLSTAISAIVGGLIAYAFNGSILPIAAGFAASSAVASVIVIAVEGPSAMFGGARSASLR
jgi:MFS transporter, DHA1 family, multidrug resistance protein